VKAFPAIQRPTQQRPQAERWKRAKSYPATGGAAGGSAAGCAGLLPIAAVFNFATVPCLVVKVRGSLETFPVTSLSP
jgi:hypothetical protein